MSRQPITSDAAAAAGTALDHSQLKDAARADHQEHSVSLKQAFLTHKKAIFWSMAMSAALVMEGYDVSLLGSFYGHPAFLRRFGVEAPGTTNGYIIPAPWQSGLSNGASAGGIIGLFINGWAADKFGSRYVMMASLVAMTAIIFMMVFANSLGMLVAAQVLVGLPWGVFQTLTTAYASEVCPIQLRGYLTAYVNMCWGIGILISSGVVKASLKMETDWAWRLPFTLQWIWIPPLFAIVWLCPESPWWLVRKGRNEDALRALQRLADPVRYTEDDAAATVSMMVHTTEMERQTTAGARYIDCFRGVDRRRTEISMMAFGMQITSGQGLVGQGVQFLQTAGISTDLAYSLNIIMNAMFVIGTMCSWVLLSLAGRRTLYSGGMFCMAATLVIIGGLSFNRDNPKTMAIGSLLIFLNFLYNSTLGPITYTIIGEMSSTRLRGKSIVLARITYKAVNIVNGIILPRMLSPKAWNLGPKCGLVYAGTATLSFLYCLLRLPETRGRSYGELNILFEKKIPAWRFKTTEVEQFVTDDLEEDVRGDDKKGEIAHIP